MPHEDAIRLAALRGRRDGLYEAVEMLAVEVLRHKNGVSAQKLKEIAQDLRVRASRLAKEVGDLERRRG